MCVAGSWPRDKSVLSRNYDRNRGCWAFLRAVANWQGLKPRSGTIWIGVTGQVVTLVLMVIGRGSDVFLSGYNSSTASIGRIFFSGRGVLLLATGSNFVEDDGPRLFFPFGGGVTDVPRDRGCFFSRFVASSSFIVLRVILRGSVLKWWKEGCLGRLNGE